VTVVVSPVVSQEFGVSVFEETSVVTYHSFCCLWKFAVFTFFAATYHSLCKTLTKLVIFCCPCTCKYVFTFIFACNFKPYKQYSYCIVHLNYMSSAIATLTLLYEHKQITSSVSLMVTASINSYAF